MIYLKIRRLLVAALSTALVAGLVTTPAAATNAGEWVLKPSFDLWSTDNGVTWVDQEPPGFDSNTAEYSSDSGATWTATEAAYLAGESGTDGNDGGNAGQFRYREPHTSRRIAEGDPRYSIDGGATWTDQGAAVPSIFDLSEATDQRRRTWVCLGEETVFTETDVGFTAPDQPCAGLHITPPYSTNVDDGVEPPGDWCVVGASAIICRGEGYTYREARRELRF